MQENVSDKIYRVVLREKNVDNIELRLFLKTM